MKLLICDLLHPLSLLLASRDEVMSSALCSQTYSACAFPLERGTKFHMRYKATSKMIYSSYFDFHVLYRGWEDIRALH
jgi:hypothetical protein